MASLEMEMVDLSPFSWVPLPDKDPRVQDWFLLGSPSPILTILAAYVVFVKVIGPVMMKDSKAFDLRPLILIYNAVMVVANTIMATRVIYYAFYSGYYAVWFTVPDLSTHPNSLLLLNISWYYLLLRISECIETVMFVLRKKFRQVSFLHVFHHVSVILSVYLYTKYGAFTIAGFELAFNALIHVVMYAYYFLSACGPSIQKYLWWKKYLTTLQLIQFVIMIMRNVTLVFWLNSRYASLPAFMLFQCFVFFMQFFHFYIKSYRQRKQEKIEAKNRAYYNNMVPGEQRKES